MASAARTSSKKLAASLNFLNQLVQELDELRVASADVYEFEDQLVQDAYSVSADDASLCYGRILANAHDRSDLNVETKFAYLLSFTLGKTRAAIEGIPVTACESRAASSGITMQATRVDGAGKGRLLQLLGKWRRFTVLSQQQTLDVDEPNTSSTMRAGLVKLPTYPEEATGEIAYSPLEAPRERIFKLRAYGADGNFVVVSCLLNSVGPYERVRLVMVGGTTSSKQCLSRLLAGSVRKVWPSIVEARSESISYTAFLGEDSFYSHQPSGFSPLDAVQLLEQWKERILVVDVLIGADYYFDFVSGRICKGKSGDSVVVKTLFGWVACGRSSLRPISAIRSLSNSHPRLLVAELLENKGT
ncbi:hypothetical protein T4B_6379 [Trichinella pseudospiralis]|uniref:Uncharacterized protein n=1 Tax=Trichinella pseudospiralis TaxID=6337 RepID=A0A0V1JMM5_TRIPS|nr:hypothetical protein T4B_6379 [Trichinella pseudospiralis]KRZ36243.1 hypothetical protein T4C_6731 [Trichinella pseudospiralis]